jgi:hypothetical protein
VAPRHKMGVGRLPMRHRYFSTCGAPVWGAPRVFVDPQVHVTCGAFHTGVSQVEKYSCRTRLRCGTGKRGTLVGGPAQFVKVGHMSKKARAFPFFILILADMWVGPNLRVGPTPPFHPPGSATGANHAIPAQI